MTNGTPIERILARKTVAEKITMSANLYANRLNGVIEGWTVNTWTESGITPILEQRMHWVQKDNGKFYDMHLNIGGESPIVLDGEATDLESQRAAVIKSTLAIWDQEWLEEEGNKI